MSMRREFAPTLIWRTAKCLLGRVDSHCTFLSESTFYWILKGEKERPISLFKCAGKYAHWSSFSICQNPTPIHFNKHPSIGIPHKPLSPSPLHTHTPHPLGILIKRSSWRVSIFSRKLVLVTSRSSSLVTVHYSSRASFPVNQTAPRGWGNSALHFNEHANYSYS